MTRAERLDEEINRLKKKSADYQNRIRELERKKKEAENSEILDIVRGGNMTADELAELLKTIRVKENKPIKKID